jgi:hypothetical protein
VARPRAALIVAAAPAIAALVAGLWSALARLAWVPAPPARIWLDHGTLMASGFLGTLISLERAAAVGGRAAVLVPIAAGASVVCVLAGLPGANVAATAAAVGLAAITALALRRDVSLHGVVLVLAALAWAVAGALSVAGWPPVLVAPWWSSFLVLTIAAERLELSRLVRPTRAARAAFVVAIGALGAGATVRAISYEHGGAFGAGLVAIAAWLLFHDVARRTVRLGGLPRFAGACVLAGHAWLAASGFLWARLSVEIGGPGWDAALHSLFVGFALSMVLGHAPIVLPALTGIPLVYRRAMWAPALLLHATLALRIAGDLAVSPEARRWGGLGNVVALGLFAATAAWSALTEAHARRAARGVAAAAPIG